MRKIISVLLLLVMSFSVFGEEAPSSVIKPKIAKYSYDAIPKDPLASAFFSATIPGTGQIYNKEYLRGAVTGVGFYSSLLTVNLMLAEWERLNTDTFYIEEAYGSPPPVHQVTSPKPENKRVALTDTKRALLGLGLVGSAGFYIWGIVDSYLGAKRYNSKLFAAIPQNLNFGLNYNHKHKAIKLSATYNFQ